MNNNQEDQFSIINKTTGEIIKDLHQGDSIISQGSKNAIKRKNAMYADKRFFIFVHIDNSKNLTDKLSNADLGHFVRVIPQVDKNTNLVVKEVKNKDSEPMKLKDIEEYLGISADSRKRVMGSWKKAGLVGMDKRMVNVNDEFVVRGSVNKANCYVKVYDEAFKEHTKRLKVNELAFLFKLIPYVSKFYPFLVSNPEENEVSELKMLNKNQIAEVTRMDRKKMDNNIAALIKAKILSQTKTGRTVVYKLNQFVITRLPNGVMPSNELNAEFIVKENEKE